MYTVSFEEPIKQIFREIGFPVYKSGYRKLCAAVPVFALDPEQSLHKELYPRLARDFCCSPASVEASIRRVIQWTWEHGNRDAWQKYFPGITRAPTNQVFIATIAECLM